jgi:hypothetical protein
MMRSGASGETDGLRRRGWQHGGSRLTHPPTSSTIRCARVTERARRIKTKRPVVRLAHSSNQIYHALLLKLLREKVLRPQHSSFDRWLSRRSN